MIRRLGLLVALLSLSVCAPVYADTVTTIDATGNVEGHHYDPEPEPCGEVVDVDATDRTDLDITSLTVVHGLRDLRITVRFADLPDVPAEGTRLQVSLLTPRSDFDVAVNIEPGRQLRADWMPRFQSRLQEASEGAGECGFGFLYSPRRCRGITAARSGETDRMVIVVPRSCFDAARAVRVAADSSGYDDELDAFFSDEHANPEGAKERLRPWYGAWVPSSKR